MAADIEGKEGTINGMKQAVGEMPMGRRLTFAGLAALVIAGFVALMLWVNQPDYQVLYSGLAQRDAASVVAKLKELKVAYQLDAGGQIIRVPGDKVYETRLALAEEGLPRGAGIGFEVFNEVKIGSTEFVQKINYQRALQGELARTISEFREVEEARVHIVMPRDSLFVEQEKKPSASVVLRLAGNHALSKSQIQGVVYLVASAVPDLTPEGVTVVDTSGHLLYRKEADTPGFPGAQTASQLEYQHSVENAFRGKVQSMLEQVLGPGRAVVRVSANLDFTRTTTTQQLFDPDQVAVRSETRSSDDSKNGSAQPVGSPDQRFSLASRNATPNQNASGQSTNKRENETTNYEISSTRRQTASAIGGLKKLSVAVVVDGTYKEATGAEGKVTRTFTPRTQEQMRQLGDIVRRAVGYDEKRGDQISLVNVPFALPSQIGTVGAADWQDYLSKYGRAALNLVLVVLFFFMVVRPLMRRIMASRPASAPEAIPAAAGGAPRPAGPGEALGPAAEDEVIPELEAAAAAPRKMTARDMILALAQQDPERTTAVLRAWIHETP